MPSIVVGDVTLSYEDTGSGAPVLLLPGTGARGRTWRLHQVPALLAAGYRAITVDPRGVGASGPAKPGLTIADLVADAAAVIEAVGGPAAVVGTSLGALIAQELSLVRPELVTHAVLLASRARPDALSQALAAADRALADAGITLPPAYDAVSRALANLSPRTLADPAAVRDWLDILEMSPTGRPDEGTRAQLDVVLADDRRAAYGKIEVPTLVLSFADDLIAPAARGRELAAAIPGACHREIPAAGHYGYLEQPEAVNEAILTFLGKGSL
ncbi:alpha/beta fold hydrolase [Actinoplanes sp. N902-109]|uniref:alpha/beta fold hydrolase n=1 Tax=Actinoplanes sp. (strain N902-109) TaxID=649831 RepID=UPI0003295CDD|nr:alpha/beta hydrolase [Actinoplanes sp. N902-109]AGL19791.1 LipE [Actinoplanes sp. N902-109]